ncbi:MAG: nitroreductase family protein [Verrucomicrobia bacterium]|nr:nitroreductase family protein [Verrucomicrobiota bacterium]
MTKGSEKRRTGYPIDPLFLDRWSARAMSGEEIAEEELLTVFEAARWAPSSYNNQPWRILYARRNTIHWPLFFDLLVDFNKTWAKGAAALLVFLSKRTFDHNGEISITHSFDTGAAWENFALQASLKNLVVHGMEGFDYEKARTVLRVPNDFQVEAMAAIGKPGKKQDLPAGLQEREAPNDRRALAELVSEGPYVAPLAGAHVA